MVVDNVIYLVVYIDGAPRVSDPIDGANTYICKQTLIHSQLTE